MIDVTALNVAARAGLAPAPCGLTNRRATLTPPGNGAAGRIPTCIVPFRRRMPRVFGHGSEKWSARQDLHLRSPGPKPGVLLLHHALRRPRLRRATEPGLGQAGHQPWKQARREDAENGGPEGTCTLNPPADNGALCLKLRVRLACRAEARACERASPPMRFVLRRDSLRSPLCSERRLVGSAGNAPVVGFRLV